jgi:ABC-type dipeptide/oligopeptide/nickel transport system permease subunit
MYHDAGEYVFVGIAVGSLISAGLGYVGFGIEALMPVILCGIAAYYLGKSKTKDS